jgi:xanthine dehydrogenase YagS FAD-binding subunit
MQAFEYTAPATKEQAVKALAAAWGETEVLAGGTDLLSLMKEYITAPKRVVDIKGIKELYGIAPKGGGLRIGALVTFEQLMASAAVKQQYRSLAQAAEGVASPQIRARGTVGGDLCQRPRCWYFRAGFGLLAQDKNDNGKPLVPDGENKYHAIFGGGPAYFVCPSSLGPALVALDAKVHILGPEGAREVAAAGFFVAPASSQERENVLKPNEIVTEIVLPPPVGRNATYEIRQRTVLDWPLATAAVALKLEGKKIVNARVVLGHVAPIPWRSKPAEDALVGKAAGEQVAAEAGEAAVKEAQPLSGNRYKVQLARVAVKRAVLQAAG